MKFSIAIAIAVSMLISGCGHVQTQKAAEWMAKTPASAWGAPPSDFSSAKVLIQSFMIDPESTRFKFGRPYRNWFETTGGQFEPHWYVEVLVNSKNRFGGYTGDKSMFLAYDRNGKLSAISPEGSDRHGWKFLD